MKKIKNINAKIKNINARTTVKAGVELNLGLYSRQDTVLQKEVYK